LGSEFYPPGPDGYAQSSLPSHEAGFRFGFE
jgi:hypothetical protein